jgi:ribokinase
MLADFAVFGVDTAAVTIRPGCQSSSCVVIISAATQTRTVVWSPGNAWTGDPVYLPDALFESAHVLHLDGLQAESALIAARRFKDSGKTVSLDAGSFHPGVDTLLPLADWLVCAESFVRRQTGAADTAEAVLALYRQYRPEVAAATQGKDGGLWTTDGQTVHRYRPMPVAAVDTTGAGDVFHGAVIYARLQGWDWPQVFAFASAVAALKCTRLGGRTGIPTRSAVDAYLARQGVAR